MIALSNRRFEKLSNDTKFVQLLQSVYFLLFSLYFTPYFSHYLRINLANKMYLLLYWESGSHYELANTTHLRFEIIFFKWRKNTLSFTDKYLKGCVTVSRFSKNMMNRCRSINIILLIFYTVSNTLYTMSLPSSMAQHLQVESPKCDMVYIKCLLSY